MVTHLVVPLALLAAIGAAPAAEASAAPGTKLENPELRTLAGGRERLLSTTAKANVFVFFRPNHERSLDALKQMAACEKELAGKAIHWAAVVSSTEPAADVSAAVAQAGIQMPVLLDDGDVLYERLGVRTHPMVGVADAKLTLVAFEPYRQIEYCEAVKARIRFLLGELDQAGLDQALNPGKTPLPGADPMKKAMRDVHMAQRLLDLRNYPEAVKFAQRALLVAPVSQAFTVMGKAYAKQGRCAEATKAFQQALRLDPKDKDAAAGSPCR